MIHIKEHEIFEREGEILYCNVPVSFTTAALGGELEVPTLDGKAQVKIPAGTQSATVSNYAAAECRCSIQVNAAICWCELPWKSRRV